MFLQSRYFAHRHIINNHYSCGIFNDTVNPALCQKNIRELLIHMICGASQSDILLRISAEVLIINLVGVVVSSLIFMSLRTTLVFMLTGIATAVIAILPVMVSIKRKPLIMQIKEEK